MKKINFIISLFSVILFSGCASSTKQPSWVDDVNKDCAKNQICAVGSGSSPNLAKTDARNNILKYFETSVNSKFKSSLSSDETRVNTYNSEDIQEISSGILKGVDIAKTYNDGREYYALAILNKNTALKEIISDLDKTDARMKLLLSENNIRYNKELERLYAKREELNKRYLVLTGSLSPEAVKYEDIFKVRKNLNISALNYYIRSSGSYADNVSSILSNVILENDAKIVSNAQKSNRIADISVVKTKMPLNIDGFVKYKYSLTIRVSRTSGGVVAVLYNDFIETGRSEAQAEDSAYAGMKKFIEDSTDIILK